LKSGNCFTCPEYTYPNVTNHECIYDTCEEETEILQPDGKCFTCDEGFIVNNNRDGCFKNETIIIEVPDISLPENPIEEIKETGTLTGHGSGSWSGRRRYRVYGQDIPTYSYVYTYSNKTVEGQGGNITYPEYDIKTTRYTGDFTYTEGNNDSCPCDLGEYTTGENDINWIVEDVAKSAAQQQALLDEEYFVPLLTEDAAAEYEPI
jgi:hypothetical protein